MIFKTSKQRGIFASILGLIAFLFAAFIGGYFIGIKTVDGTIMVGWGGATAWLVIASSCLIFTLVLIVVISAVMNWIYKDD